MAIPVQELPSTDRYTVTNVTVAYPNGIDPIYELGNQSVVPYLCPRYAVVDMTLHVYDLAFLDDLANLAAFEDWITPHLRQSPSPVLRCPWCGTLKEDGVKCRYCGGPF